ncbi:diguanylate cyclase (GGDEF)-like protein [Kineococcus xinjiangensis]|uniref:Diguanylate cyclase (GGDEF)-like protein n=1 Tax=Kineococcus xinjiangensis TaxID=512762 RepID=A0A2S6IF98_9ACTN|nr:bifunctional diguanylate cyclase/phosphodiesterase [Kineococcus xinjiangensis]PPK92881.1 diguanylate cyclase (GGDEF)-like protein [Kineococcus xinjiangensis]
MTVRLGVQLAVVAALVLTALAVPALRTPLLLATNWLSVALVVAGMRRHRPGHRGVWVLVVALVALVAAGNTAVALAGAGPAALAATSGAQLTAVAALPLLLRTGPATTAASTAGAGRARWLSGRVLDLSVLTVVVVLAASELLLRGLELRAERDLPWVLVVAPSLDVAMAGALLWAVFSRTRLGPAMVLAMTAGFGCLAYDLLVTLDGRRVALPGEPLQALGIANMLLFGLAATHPSMAALGGTRTPAHLRRSSVQLLLLLPCVLAPTALLSARAAGAHLHLPGPVLTAATFLVIVAVLLRAFTALRGSEDGAEREPLTSLLNRRGLARAYAEATSTTSTCSPVLVMVDLDDFKRVNDRHGHGAGDALLQTVAQRLRAAVPAPGAVARPGGDEFLVLQDAAGVPAAEIGRALLAALRAPVDVAGSTVHVTASIGVVEVRRGDDLERVLADADIAMYAAKASGKSAVAVFSPALREAALTSFTLAEDLRDLLDGGDPARVGELFVLHQPLVDLGTGLVVGAEALVRWRHPERGLIRPDEFLGVAERQGTGARVDDLVLHRALAQLRAWDAEGPAGITVSVNLGLSSICDPTLARRVLAALAEHRLAPERLHLEITEHDALPDDDAVRARLQELVDAGVVLSLDDFGVGYTSLSYLRRFPISILKIDRSLVAHDDEASRSLRAGIAALAATLDLHVVAEGVEHPHQAQALRELGITFGQGYHFAPPLAAEAFAQHCAARAGATPAPPPAALSR